MILTFEIIRVWAYLTVCHIFDISTCVPNSTFPNQNFTTDAAQLENQMYIK